jgi:transmembrane sensor
MEQIGNNRNYTLFLKCMQGKATDDEYQEAWKLISEKKEYLSYYIELRDLWIASGLYNEISEDSIRTSWEKVKKQTLDQAKDRKKVLTIRSGSRISLILKSAAFLLFFFGLGILFSMLINQDNKSESFITTIEAPKGGKSLLILEDGSRVILNAGSKIQYTKAYNVKDRYLNLVGEAYFQVKKNKNLPFKVYVLGYEVKALGTNFNVCAYPDDNFIRTTLVEGSVVITSKNDLLGKRGQIVLRPNQSVVIYTKPQLAENKNAIDVPKIETEKKYDLQDNINVEKYTSWKDKRWVFEKEYMADLAVKLERRYNVKIIFHDADLTRYKITGTLEDETLDQLLSAIRLTIPMNYKIEKDTVTLYLDQDIKEKYNRLIQ